MKKVILLGDSIRLCGYGPLVPGLLGDGYSVWQPEDNCRFSAYTLRMLFDERAHMEGADVIHWNNGLWDTCDLFGDGAFTPMDTYVSLLVRMADILKTYAPHVIFATTTVPAPNRPDHSWARIRAYNTAAVEALRPLGVRINDLCTPVAEQVDTMICEDCIHLSPEGSLVVARRVAEAIRAAAES